MGDILKKIQEIEREMNKTQKNKEYRTIMWCNNLFYISILLSESSLYEPSYPSVCRSVCLYVGLSQF